MALTDSKGQLTSPQSTHKFEQISEKASDLLSKIRVISFPTNSEQYLSELLFIVNQNFSAAVFSSSLGIEDQVITDQIFSKNLKIEIFTLDTGRLFPQTYSLLVTIKEKYQKDITVYFPDQQDIEEYVNKKGINAFYQSVNLRHECCHIRKVKPLQRALQGADIWITGIRKDQSSLRAKQDQVVEIDEEKKIIKVHPLYYWSFAEVQDYVKKKNVPYNVLHNQNYLSVGCQPCTRPIQLGEDFRAGRWWWEQESRKECGLHFNKDGQLERTKK